jgi:hypothetical protein
MVRIPDVVTTAAAVAGQRLGRAKAALLPQGEVGDKLRSDRVEDDEESVGVARDDKVVPRRSRNEVFPGYRGRPRHVDLSQWPGDPGCAPQPRGGESSPVRDGANTCAGDSVRSLARWSRRADRSDPRSGSRVNERPPRLGSRRAFWFRHEFGSPNPPRRTWIRDLTAPGRNYPKWGSPSPRTWGMEAKAPRPPCRRPRRHGMGPAGVPFAFGGQDHPDPPRGLGSGHVSIHVSGCLGDDPLRPLDLVIRHHELQVVRRVQARSVHRSFPAYERLKLLLVSGKSGTIVS